MPYLPNRNVISCDLSGVLPLQAFITALIRRQREKSSKRKGIIFTLSLLDKSRICSRRLEIGNGGGRGDVYLSSLFTIIISLSVSISWICISPLIYAKIPRLISNHTKGE